jgi:hypothetical protein
MSDPFTFILGALFGWFAALVYREYRPARPQQGGPQHNEIRRGVRNARAKGHMNIERSACQVVKFSPASLVFPSAFAPCYQVRQSELGIIVARSKESATMRVWVYPERKYENLGAVRYELSWEEVRLSAKGKEEIDPDLDLVHRYATFKDKESALAEARKVVDSYQTAYGEVTVTRQIVDWYVEEDRIAEWADTKEREYVS